MIDEFKICQFLRKKEQEARIWDQGKEGTGEIYPLSFLVTRKGFRRRHGLSFFFLNEFLPSETLLLVMGVY